MAMESFDSDVAYVGDVLKLSTTDMAQAVLRNLFTASHSTNKDKDNVSSMIEKARTRWVEAILMEIYFTGAPTLSPISWPSMILQQLTHEPAGIKTPSDASSSNSPSRLNLLTLPFDIRHLILRHALAITTIKCNHSSGLALHQRFDTPFHQLPNKSLHRCWPSLNPNLGLLLTCKQLKEESNLLTSRRPTIRLEACYIWCAEELVSKLEFLGTARRYVRKHAREVRWRVGYRNLWSSSVVGREELLESRVRFWDEKWQRRWESEGKGKGEGKGKVSVSGWHTSSGGMVVEGTKSLAKTGTK